MMHPKIFSRLKSKKGMALLETAIMVMFFMGFIIWSTTSAIAIMDTSRDGRTAGLAGDMVRQLFEENPNPTHTDMLRVTQILEDTGYFRQGEDYRVIVSVYENHWLFGHVRSGYSAQGPNTVADTQVISYGSSWPTSGVEIGGTLYQLDANELMYVAEIYSGQRGRVDTTGGVPPFYEIAVMIDEP